MTFSWREPVRIEAHRLMRRDVLDLLPSSAALRDELPLRKVDEVFHAGLLKDVVLGSQREINTRIDSFFDIFRINTFFENAVDLPTWGIFGAEANSRRSVDQALLGQTSQVSRQFIASAPGRFLVLALPFENRERRNNTHEVLYFRDSGIHRRLIERTLGYGENVSSGTNTVDGTREHRLASYDGKRWEAFVVNTIIDLVRDRCNAFAYRHEETREIDLVLEWNDGAPAERWAIEVASVKFNTHPSRYFAEECRHLGVHLSHCYVVRRADYCDGGARGRGGVPAISLPRMIDILRQRMRR